MYDYSLHAVASLPAKVGDKLITTKYSNIPTRLTQADVRSQGRSVSTHYSSVENRTTISGVGFSLTPRIAPHRNRVRPGQAEPRTARREVRRKEADFRPI
jgi:hypothetical protein